MRNWMFAALIFLFAGMVIGVPPWAWAQVDVSTQILLQSSDHTSPDAAGLQTGRYKIKKSATTPAALAKKLPEKKVQSTGGQTQDQAVLNQSLKVSLPPTPTPPPKPDPKMEALLFANTTTTTTSLTTSTTAAVVTTTTMLPPSNVLEVKEEPVQEAPTAGLVLGSDPSAVESYREQIHPDDIRLNQVEINILPGIVADTSKSSYSFRNYSTFSPKITVGGEFWASPFLGVYGNYTTSISADTTSGSTDRIPVTHTWTELGLDLRKFFGMSRRSNSIEFGLLYSEYKFTVPGDDMNRVGLKSSGFGLHLKTRVPVAPTYAWVFGGKFIPRLQHSEGGSGLSLSSGGAGESSRMDLSLGGEWKLSRQNQIIWDIGVAFEKDQFSGQANTPDPETGVAPKGVGVDNTFTFFSFGYRWGQ